MSVKFGFSKVTQKSAVIESVLPSSSEKIEDSSECIATYDASNRKRKSDAPLVIPLVKRNVYRKQNEKPITEKSSLDSLGKVAAAEILEQTKILNDAYESRTGSSTGEESSIVVDMLANRPDGEEDSQINFEARPECSSLDDYSDIPIQGFGMAMLRGMGFKKSVGIGKTFKQAVDPIEVNLRPKGLGLGACPMGGHKNPQLKDDEPPPDPIRKGDKVHVATGPHKNTVGKMIGIDEDGTRFLIQDENDAGTISVSMMCVQHYSEYAKTLLKDLESDKTSSSDLSNGRSVDENEKRASNGSTSRTSLKGHHKSSKKSWLTSDVIVRIVDKTFKKGRYYKEKARIIDVVTPFLCSCETTDGKLLEEMPQDSLETVIPRGERALVKLLTGTYKGSIGEVLESDRDRCICQVILSEHDDVIVKCSFDDVCQFAGSRT